MKNVEVRIVNSLSEQIDAMNNQIRVRAYEKFLSRDPQSHSQMQDWLEAESEIIASPVAEIVVEQDQIIAELAIPAINAETLVAEATSQEVLIRAEGQVPLFSVVRLPQPIVTGEVRVTQQRGKIRISAPTQDMSQVLRQTA